MHESGFRDILPKIQYVHICIHLIAKGPQKMKWNSFLCNHFSQNKYNFNHWRAKPVILTHCCSSDVKTAMETLFCVTKITWSTTKCCHWQQFWAFNRNKYKFCPKMTNLTSEHVFDTLSGIKKTFPIKTERLSLCSHLCLQCCQQRGCPWTIWTHHPQQGCEPQAPRCCRLAEGHPVAGVGDEAQSPPPAVEVACDRCQVALWRTGRTDQPAVAKTKKPRWH